MCLGWIRSCIRYFFFQTIVTTFGEIRCIFFLPNAEILSMNHDNEMELPKCLSIFLFFFFNAKCSRPIYAYLILVLIVTTHSTAVFEWWLTRERERRFFFDNQREEIREHIHNPGFAVATSESFQESFGLVRTCMPGLLFTLVFSNFRLHFFICGGHKSKYILHPFGKMDYLLVWQRIDLLFSSTNEPFKSSVEAHDRGENLINTPAMWNTFDKMK